ncbi:MobV family relaxase [Ornithobacterium rhinotracheale]|uniref:MobV family relaxase n=1 Tax=Ornithobacterium rhinotracheale TaxID=28251 RepID=UPI001FF5D3BE|nr:MobV family relaxase [Ornithobacterium rhinotracheale]MCK0201400.1 plasmid recombination protein [Ornithobacterium rhinotracheale]
MGYAVLHSEKGKTSSGGIGNHIDRVAGAEHTYLHADKSRTHLNVNIGLLNDYHKKPLKQAIAERIEEGYKGKKAIRKDAVKYMTHVLTGTHEDMVEIFKDEEKKDAWIISNVKFLIDEFGRENIVRATVHLDEKTPHMHAVIVPLTEDGRLSAKEVMGNKKEMQERQDRYAEEMEKFGLKRGIRSTGIKHESAREYYARISPKRENIDDLRQSKLFGLSKPLDEEKVLAKVSYLENEIKNKEIQILKMKDRVSIAGALKANFKAEKEETIKWYRRHREEAQKRESLEREISSLNADMSKLKEEYRYNIKKVGKQASENTTKILTRNPEIYKQLRNEYLQQQQKSEEMERMDKIKAQAKEQAEKILKARQNREQEQNKPRGFRR